MTFADTPVLVTGVGTQTDGNYSAAQLANTGGDWLLAVNDSGDYVRRFNGTDWAYLSTTTPADWAISTVYAVNDRARDTADGTRWKCLVAHTSPGTGTFAAARTAAPTQWTREMASDTVSFITGPATAPAPVQNGQGLTHVWKHANRFFFVQGGSMNAWCLPVHAVGGELVYIPLSGATKRGGSLLFGASWSVDTGSGLDDKCIFVTDQGEVVIFAGTDPTASANWRQEGCYDISRPLGKNAHTKLGGDILVATVDGIVPLTATMQKDVSALSLAAITYNIEPMWKREFMNKRTYPWTLAKWDEGSALLVSFPRQSQSDDGHPHHRQRNGWRQQSAHRGMVPLYRLGRAVLHATARLAVLRHAGRQDHAGRKQQAATIRNGTMPTRFSLATDTSARWLAAGRCFRCRPIR